MPRRVDAPTAALSVACLALAACGGAQPTRSNDAAVDAAHDAAPPSGDAAAAGVANSDAAHDAPVTSPCPPAAAPALGPGFTDVSQGYLATPPFAVLDDANHAHEPTYGLLADLDGDGSTELLVGAKFLALTGERRRAAVYRWQSNALARTPMPGFEVAFTPMAALDLDGDGLVDLVGQQHQPVVAWGTARGAVGAPTPLARDRPSMNFDRLQAVHVADVDEDGWLDVVTGEAGCCPDCEGRDLYLHLRTGPRRFADRSELLPRGAASGSTAAFAAEMRPGELVLGTFGTPCDQDRAAQVFYRRSGVDASGHPRFEAFDPVPRDASFYTDREHAFLSRHAPMGATAADLDADGTLDLVVTLDPLLALFRGRAAWPFEDRTLDSIASRTALPDNGALQVPWATAALDIDRDGRLDLVTTHGNDNPRWSDAAFRSGQSLTLHTATSGFCFADASARSNLGRRGQWYSLTVGDLDGDGDADLVAGGQGEHARTWRNDVAAARGSLALRLRGSTSNALGVGARVDVDPDGPMPAQRLVAGSFASPITWSEPLVFVTAGASGRAPRTRITWPSGLVQELSGLEAGRVHTVQEPALVTLSTATRHLAADGAATATVRVTPRNPDGSMRAASRVGVTLRAESGSTSLPAAREADGAWTATVPARATPGTAVVVVTLDDVEVRVRPRLWWDAPGG